MHTTEYNRFQIKRYIFYLQKIAFIFLVFLILNLCFLVPRLTFIQGSRKNCQFGVFLGCDHFCVPLLRCARFVCHFNFFLHWCIFFPFVYSVCLSNFLISCFLISISFTFLSHFTRYSQNVRETQCRQPLHLDR